MNPSLRKYVSLIMLQAQIPPRITAGKIVRINYHAYLQVSATADLNFKIGLFHAKILLLLDSNDKL